MTRTIGRDIWRSGRRGLAGVLLALLALLDVSIARGQVDNPVYVDDSPAAEEVLQQLDTLVAGGNQAEAIRALQGLLEREPDRLAPEAGDRDLFWPVRRRVHAALLSRPELLDRYRRSLEPVAQRLLEQGRPERVEAELLLTPSGYDAALALARGLLRDGLFESAVLTLEQLEAHPDRAGEKARAAVLLLAELSRYTRRPADRARAERWAQQAGVSLDPRALDPIEPPPTAARAAYASFDPMPDLATLEPLARPLRSTPLSGGEPTDPAVLRGEPVLPWILPTPAGDLLLVNDGQNVSAFDGATLERLWTMAVPGEGLSPAELRSRRQPGQGLEDSLTVTAGGGVAVAVTGHAIGRRRTGDARVHGMDVLTGEALWSLRPSAIDVQLASAVLYGPVVISDDTAVLGFFTFSPLRRVHLAHLAGLDLYTGRVRWLRLMGTAGVLPSQRGTDLAPAMLEEGGVVYRVEPLGVISAVEARSGRPVWSRRMPSSSSGAPGGPTRDAWEQPVPVMAGGLLLTVAPDQATLVGLDPATGAMRGQRWLGDLEWPDYLLRAGDHVVLVGHGRVLSLRADAVLGGEGASSEPVALTAEPLTPTGRGVVVGRSVLLPTARGALLLDPVSGASRPLELEFPGAPAVLQGQLLMVGGGAVHGYLDWPNARRVLRERLSESPADPRPAVALAELAYRAGAFGEVAEAARSALGAIAAAETGDEPGAAAESSRRRLVLALTGMLNDETPLRTGDRGAIVEALAAAAATPDERVGAIMQRARWLSDRGEDRQAAAEYQSILIDPALAEAQHGTRWRLERADRAATAALARLTEREGFGIYRAFDQRAQEQLDVLLAEGPAAGGAQPLEALARRFPLARSSPRAWLAAADLHREGSRGRLEAAALQAGFESALAVTRRRVDPAVAAELSGRLIESQIQADRLFSARQTLRLAHERLGLDMVPTGAGQTAPIAELDGQLRRRLEQSPRLAQLAPSPGRMEQLLGGWSIVRPAMEIGPRPTGLVMLRSQSRGVLALWGAAGQAGVAMGLGEGGGGAGGGGLGFDPGEGVSVRADAADTLAPLWSRPAGADAENDPRLIGMTPTDVLLYHSRFSGASLEMIDALTGRTRWRTPAFGTLFEGEPARYAAAFVDTPLDGRQWLREHLIVGDGTHVALVERFGRVAVFEQASGRVVLAAQLGVPMVYDAALRDGVLALVGERAADPARRETPGAVPLAAAYELGTGSAIYGPAEFREPNSFGRWVRLPGDGSMLLGLDLGVVGIDLAHGQVLWTVDDPAIALSGDAWLARDRAYILGVDRQLWQVDLAQGHLLPRPLEDLGRVAEASTVRAEAMPTGETVLASDLGMVIFDAAGKLVGGDGIGRSARLLRPEIADGLVMSVSTTPGIERLPQGPRVTYLLSSFVLPSGRLSGEARLELPETPQSLLVLDDTVLIGLDEAVAVFSARRDQGP